MRGTEAIVTGEEGETEDTAKMEVFSPGDKHQPGPEKFLSLSHLETGPVAVAGREELGPKGV